MKQEYRLSAEAILYTVLRLHKRSFYGVDNVLEGLTESKFPMFAQQAELELIDSGCATLDFDGVFAFEPAYARLIERCADCGAVVTVCSREGQKQQRRTCYLTGDGTPTLRQEGEGYILSEGGDFAAEVPEMLNLPGENTLTEALVDSTLVEEQDEAGLKEAGCSPELAALIVSSARGEGGYAAIERESGGVMTDQLSLIYGTCGAAAVLVEYTETAELFRFCPVTPRWVTERLRMMAE